MTASATRLSHAPQRDKGGGEPLAQPLPLVRLPWVGDEVVVERLDQLVFVLGVVAQTVKCSRSTAIRIVGVISFAGWRSRYFLSE